METYTLEGLFEYGDEANLDCAIDQICEVMQNEGYEITGYDDIEWFAGMNRLLFDEYGLMLNYKTPAQKMAGSMVLGIVIGTAMAVIYNIGTLLGVIV